MYKICLFNSIIKYFQFLVIFLIIDSLIINSGHIIINAERIERCDFQKYTSNGCRNTDTQECDRINQICKCKKDFPIVLTNGICLDHKSIDEGCMGSVQCNQIPNSGCYGLDTEFKDDFWVHLWHKFGLTDPGKCGCDTRRGYSFDHKLKACVKSMIIGSKCSNGWECYSRVSNSNCTVFDRCECKTGYYYETQSDSCKSPLNYGDSCDSNEGCFSAVLRCDEGICKCRSDYHFDRYKQQKCQPNSDDGCPENYRWSEQLGNCIDKNMRMDIPMGHNLNKLNEFDLIEPPRIYSIFVILALWICLLFILGNAKRGLRLVENAVRRDQSSQYLQCDTCAVDPFVESEQRETVVSQLSLHSSISSSINQCIPPPAFDELYPSNSQPYSDDPPTYEEVVMFDKEKDLVVV